MYNNTSRNWLQEINATSIEEIAHKIGTGRACPSCKQTTRGTNDRRAPYKITGSLWHCKRCKEGSNQVGFITIARTGKKSELTPSEWRQCREFAESCGLCYSDIEYSTTYKFTAAPTPVKQKQKKYPPSDLMKKIKSGKSELAALELKYLESRALSIDDTNSCGAFVIRNTGVAEIDKYIEYGFNLIIPLYSVSGVIKSYKFRRIDNKRGAKCIGISGYKMGGTIMANKHGAQLLKGEKFDSALIVEGEMDLLTWGNRVNYPVFGWFQDNDKDKILAKISKCAHVCVRTHQDDAGDEYFKKIRSVISHAKRGNIGNTMDENDLLIHGLLPESP